MKKNKQVKKQPIGDPGCLWNRLKWVWCAYWYLGEDASWCRWQCLRLKLFICLLINREGKFKQHSPFETEKHGYDYYAIVFYNFRGPQWGIEYSTWGELAVGRGLFRNWYYYLYSNND